MKDALEIGADSTVKLTGRPDGYFGNEAIKFLLPKNLRSLEKGLRAIGYGPKVDAFVLSMNRAAETDRSFPYKPAAFAKERTLAILNGFADGTSDRG